MIDIFCQIKNFCLIPNGPEDADKVAEEYTANQLVRCKVTLVSKALEPSIEQNNLLHKCFELVADNSAEFESKDAAKFRCKVGIDYRHKDRVAVTPGGKVVCEYRSFSFGSLHGKERLTVVDQAFEWCAADIGLTVEEMVEEAKNRMVK
jgi:hypothetical protein